MEKEIKKLQKQVSNLFKLQILSIILIALSWLHLSWTIENEGSTLFNQNMTTQKLMLEFSEIEERHIINAIKQKENK